MTLEEFFEAVRKIAYAGDCDSCGVPDELLHLVMKFEGKEQ